jgi:hypothetical protein
LVLRLDNTVCVEYDEESSDQQPNRNERQCDLLHRRFLSQGCAASRSSIYSEDCGHRMLEAQYPARGRDD